MESQVRLTPLVEDGDRKTQEAKSRANLIYPAFNVYKYMLPDSQLQEQIQKHTGRLAHEPAVKVSC